MIRKRIKKFDKPSVAIWERENEFVVATLEKSNPEGLLEMYEVFTSDKFCLVLNYGIVVASNEDVIIPFEALELLGIPDKKDISVKKLISLMSPVSVIEKPITPKKPEAQTKPSEKTQPVEITKVKAKSKVKTKNLSV